MAPRLTNHHRWNLTTHGHLSTILATARLRMPRSSPSARLGPVSRLIPQGCCARPDPRSPSHPHCRHIPVSVAAGPSACLWQPSRPSVCGASKRARPGVHSPRLQLCHPPGATKVVPRGFCHLPGYPPTRATLRLRSQGGPAAYEVEEHRRRGQTLDSCDAMEAHGHFLEPPHGATRQRFESLPPTKTVPTEVPAGNQQWGLAHPSFGNAQDLCALPGSSPC
mmetsp:Transcript_82753/g.208295  ORF Transcript_82753/g.208295 Transcript_82753/m.208295 type:complete len:222 (+) Transcript_82753:1915-2580(+)